MKNKNQPFKYLQMNKTFEQLSPAAAELAKPPRLDSIKRALFIQPHPDDNQVGAGGTMAYLVSRGVEVFELTVLDDRFSDLDYSGEGLTVRQAEALAAAECLGTTHVGFVGYGDRTKVTEREITDAIIPYIRQVRPDVVFTPDPYLENENHEDHVKVPRAAMYAVRDACIGFLPELLDGKKRTDRWRTGMIAFYYTPRPNTIIDVTDFQEKKIAAMGCHASQMSDEVYMLVELFSNEMALGTPYKAAEGFRVISQIHTHCFHFPIINR